MPRHIASVIWGTKVDQDFTCGAHHCLSVELFMLKYIIMMAP
jgi:hypothetical protein